MIDNELESLKQRVKEKFSRPEWREAVEAVRAHEAISWHSYANGEEKEELKSA